jgi:hypothetical protein
MKFIFEIEMEEHNCLRCPLGGGQDAWKCSVTGKIIPQIKPFLAVNCPLKRVQADVIKERTPWEYNEGLIDKINGLAAGEKVTYTLLHTYSTLKYKATFTTKIKESGFIDKWGSWIFQKSMFSGPDMKPGKAFWVRDFRHHAETRIPIDNKLIDIKKGW